MTRTVLHAGCGREPLPAWLEDCEEVRLDIDAGVQPHIVASITDMGEIGPFDVLYTSHCVEHLYPHEVVPALRGFKRVLAADGIAVIIVPDLEDVRPTEDVVYVSPAGPVCGLDMIYGMSRLIPHQPHMAHHCGFTHETLTGALKAAGFERVAVARKDWNLIAMAS